MRNNTSWLQHIPKHWEVKRLKDLGFFYGGLSGKSGDDFQCEDENIIKPFIPYTNILNNFYVNSQVVKFVLINDNEEQNKVQKGDLLFLMSSEDYESIAKASVFCEDVDVMYLNSFCKGLRITNKKVYSPFLCYVLSNDECRDAIRLEAQGFTRINIKTGKVASASIPLPPLSEQEKIARYLDTKVGEIDQKVSLIEKKIERYQLLKKSIINKVVSTGLHPEAPRKDTQISCLGHIPEHWEVKRFKSIARTIKGKVVEYFDTPSDDANFVLTVDTLRNDNPQFLNYAVTSDSDQLCKVNDIIVIWDGAGVGEFLRAKEGLISSTTARIDVNKSIVNKDYFWYFGDKIEEIMKHMPTGMGIPHLNPIILSNMQFTLPPLSEQQEIASYLDQKCADIDAIIANCTAQIEKYKTLKRALINEVVTGQRTIE